MPPPLAAVMVWRKLISKQAMSSLRTPDPMGKRWPELPTWLRMLLPLMGGRDPCGRCERFLQIEIAILSGNVHSSAALLDSLSVPRHGESSSEHGSVMI